MTGLTRLARVDGAARRVSPSSTGPAVPSDVPVHASPPDGSVRSDSGHIRVVITDDHPIFRDGLRSLLSTHSWLTVVGDACDGDAAVRLVRDLQPDILLLDYTMPRQTGLDVLHEIAQRSLKVRTIVLTANVPRAEVVNLLRAGARGVVLKDAETDLLLKAIRCVHAGEIWVGRETTCDLVAALAACAEQPVAPPRTFGLTPREREIMQLVVDGETNAGIASRLSVGRDTVKHHLTSIFDKTGVSTRVELAIFALHHRLVDPS